MSIAPVDNAAAFGGKGNNNDMNHRLARDRSYSDAHCLFDKKSGDAASRLFLLASADGETDVKEGTGRAKTHHHGMNRPRSKSESEYRPSHLKKKHPHRKQPSGPHSPHRGPRPCSPKNLVHPTSCGKMWIRPVPLLGKAGRSSPPQLRYENLPHSSPFTSSQSIPHVREVSQSPPDEAEMDISIPMLYASPSSSFDAYNKEKPVAFGESGKPIKPIAMFRQESPTDTCAAQLFPWQH
jgi:hypothetical protein